MKNVKELRAAQTLRNVLGCLEFNGWEYELPCVRANQQDRVIVDDSDLAPWLDKHPELFGRWDFVRNHGVTAKRGWRERVAMWSMQVVEHDSEVLEIDFDRFNPDGGAAPALGHMVEVLWHRLTSGKTDAFDVMRGLRGRGIQVLDVRAAEGSKI